jgi:hypothetical protein
MNALLALVAPSAAAGLYACWHRATRARRLMTERWWA